MIFIVLDTHEIRFIKSYECFERAYMHAFTLNVRFDANRFTIIEGVY